MAAGRVLAAHIVSDVNVPGFDRATMDGYAVMAESTEGATSYNRLPLVVLGDSMPGHGFDGPVGLGQSVRIMTGAPLPLGCDAVLPAEWIEDAASTAAVVSAVAAVSPGKNVGRTGEDIVRGTTLFQAGRVLRPQDLGVLSSEGVGEIRVFSRPHVRLVVTGNELLPSVRSRRVANRGRHGPMLAALARATEVSSLSQVGARPLNDRGCAQSADVIIVSGGSVSA
jgi:molybdopterin molybdotransferase